MGRVRGMMSMVRGRCCCEPVEPHELDALSREAEDRAERTASYFRLPRFGFGATPERTFRALPRGETTLTAETPTVGLEPDRGNIHAFEARTPVAVLDVLIPPYNEASGRDCHYFAFADGDEQLLRVVACPPTLHIRRGAPCDVSAGGAADG